MWSEFWGKVYLDGGNHASRLMILSGPLLIIIGLGYTKMISWLLENRKFKIMIPVFISVWLLAVTLYLHQYFVHYPIESSRYFGYGYKQAINKIIQVKDQFKLVRLTDNNDPPMLYYFYWSNTPAKAVQDYGVEFGEKIIKNKPLDSIKPYNPIQPLCMSEEIKKLDSNTIYMVTFGNLPLDFRSKDKDKVPTGIKLIDVIKYPDNEVAYYLVTRDSSKGINILPDKTNSCK